VADLLDNLRGKLVVSCQPVDDGPMDRPDITAAMARAAEAGGAAGLRIEGIANLEAVRPVTSVPIIGILKRELSSTGVRITPLLEDVAGLAAAGAKIIGYDATARARPVPTAALVKAIRGAGCLAMADCGGLADGERAIGEGADILGTTLSGYVYQMVPDDAGPDLDLIAAFAKLGTFVMAEGRINSPVAAGNAMAAGANCVTVGSAITRIEIITGWFAKAIGGLGHG
jgi:N-acylglucosamine-6-phosphate 2-epimerase